MKKAVFILGILAAWGMPGGLRAEETWKPYEFKGNETFVYEIRQTRDGTEKTGKYVIDLSREEKRYVIKLEGKFDDMEGSTTLKVSSGSEVQERLLPQMFFNPWMAPLTVTLFAQGMVTAVMTAMTAGAEPGSRQVYKKEGKTTEYRVETCEFQGKKGKRYVVVENGQITYESCVIQDIALPTYIKTRTPKGEVTEVVLKEYKEK